MALIFGLDIGTTSIGFAVIDHDPDKAEGKVRRLGVRIFPEARDPAGTPLNHERRQARMRRRQLRRSRQRRRDIGAILHEAGFLPDFDTSPKSDWGELMKLDPYDLRARALDESEALTPYEFGRALYHLAKRRHFKGRDLEEDDGASGDNRENRDEESADEKQAKNDRETTLKDLDAEKKKDPRVTLGAWLSKRGPHERKRRVHATRAVVEEEFDKLWTAQAGHHQALQDQRFKGAVREAIFSQRPVFWRKKTLGKCRFMPDKQLCPKGSWLSQQRRMLEKLNNLEVVVGESRPLNKDERAHILDKLQTQASMTWAGVRTALKPLYKKRGESGAEKSLKFNLELGGEKKLIGNPLEAKLAKIFGDGWKRHTHKQAIRDAVHDRLWSADYGEVGSQRVVILPQAERRARREAAARSFIDEFSVSEEQAAALAELKLPTGWEPYSIEALRAMLPHLENGVRFGALMNGPEWELWRNETFPDRERPTGKTLDRLPSPADEEEHKHIAKLRNPTVVRTRNELRKVVNNLIDMFGKPDLIRVELTRDVGKSKREREEIQSGIRRQERRRDAAKKDLQEKGITEPSRDDVEKWLLWKESKERCPYTGDHICFAALFQEDEFEVEHIWPRSRSLDDSFRNKTLCRRDVNAEKGNRTPFEYLGSNADRWSDITDRLQKMRTTRGGDGMSHGMSPGKIKRFLAHSIPDDFAARQLNDTGYAAREAVAFLKRLWPDRGPQAPVTVQSVSGRVTAQLRKLWCLNNILDGSGEKTRSDHRHHAIDALVVACAHPCMTQRLSHYWQARERLGIKRPLLSPPWQTVRADTERAVAEIIVSHRVRKKVSGRLHKETTYGDTKKDATTKSGTYRQFVTRKKVETLSKSELSQVPETDGEGIRDEKVREIVTKWVEDHGGDPKKAFPPYPNRSPAGPEIRKVRILKKQQLHLMAQTATGYADLGDNHHIAIFRLPDGKTDFEVVSLFEAARRLAKREPVVRRERNDGAQFIMSLSSGDVIEFQEGEEEGLWVVHGIASNGRPTLAGINDARPTSVKESEKRGMDGKRKDFEPRFGGFMLRRPRKVSIDPIGRIRPAND